MASQQDGETIANSRYQYSTFTEDDANIFYHLLEQYYSYYVLHHGLLADQVASHRSSETLPTFEEQLADFTRNFSKYFFTEEYAKNFFWNICF